MLTNACVKVAKSWRPNYGESRARHPLSQIAPLHEPGWYRPPEAQQCRQHSCELTALSAKSSGSFTRSDALKSSARASYFLPTHFFYIFRSQWYSRNSNTAMPSTVSVRVSIISRRNNAGFFAWR
jgi:hypothetical protein